MSRFLLVLLIIAGGVRTAAAQEGYAQASGARVFYRIVGEGPPLLLVNGGPGWSSEHMTPVARRLGESFQVIRFDQRGTGRSVPAVVDSTTITMAAMIEDMEALRRHLDVERWLVMGHSFGGMLAMAYTAEHPERAEALVLSAPAGATTDFMDYYPASLNDRLLPHEREAASFWSDPERMAAAPGKATYELIRASAGAFLYDRSRIDDMLALIDENTWSIQASNLVWADLARTGFDIREPLGSFERPVMVVQGRQDALGVHHAYLTAELFPRSELRIIEESAHIMWLDQPDQYYEAVLGFLERVQ